MKNLGQAIMTFESDIRMDEIEDSEVLKLPAGIDKLMMKSKALRVDSDSFIDALNRLYGDRARFAISYTADRDSKDGRADASICLVDIDPKIRLLYFPKFGDRIQGRILAPSMKDMIRSRKIRLSHIKMPSDLKVFDMAYLTYSVSYLKKIYVYEDTEIIKCSNKIKFGHVCDSSTKVVILDHKTEQLERVTSLREWFMFTEADMEDDPEIRMIREAARH